jgi:predicted RNase H-like nuclease (RuvC/YqgF family)
MQVANGRIRTYRLDERTTQWQLDNLLERIEQVETKNGVLRAKLMEARDRVMQLEMQNRELRGKLSRSASAAGAD